MARRGSALTGARGRDLVVQTWIVTRGLLLLTALWVVLGKKKAVTDDVSNWDAQHYYAIAVDGYADPTNRAFFPGLPAVLHAGSLAGLPMAFTGVMLAVVCSAFAAWALFRLGGAVAAGLWLVAPMTVFTVVPYTEAPFCAFAFWAWERARAGRWWQAGLLAAGACTFRISGVFLVGGLGLLALTLRGSSRDRIARLLPMLLPIAVVAAYVVYLHQTSGSWTAWYDAQRQGWTRGFADPLTSLRHTLDAAKGTSWPGRPLVATVFGFEVVSMAAGLITTVVCLVKRRWAEAGYVGVQVAVFATSYWFMSVSRAVLLWFPLFLLLAELMSWQPRTVGVRVVRTGLVAVAATASLVTSVFWAWLFFTGNWAS